MAGKAAAAASQLPRRPASRPRSSALGRGGCSEHGRFFRGGLARRTGLLEGLSWPGCVCVWGVGGEGSQPCNAFPRNPRPPRLAKTVPAVGQSSSAGWVGGAKRRSWERRFIRRSVGFVSSPPQAPSNKLGSQFVELQFLKLICKKPKCPLNASPKEVSIDLGISVVYKCFKY